MRTLIQESTHEVNHKRSPFFVTHTCTLSKAPPPPTTDVYDCPKLCLHPFVPHPRDWCYHSTPYNRKLLRTEGNKMQWGGGWVTGKEIWLFNTKKTGMQGVNPLDGSSANKRPSFRQRLVRGVRTRGRGWLSLTIWLFCLGEGAGLCGPSESLKPSHDPPSPRAVSQDRRPTNSVNTIEALSKPYKTLNNLTVGSQ